MNILRDTFCLYCQHEYPTPRALQTHVMLVHPDSYAARSIEKARKR